MKKITNLEISAIFYFLIRACLMYICFNNLIQFNKQDSYISIVIGAIISVIPLITFLFIFNYEPNYSLFEKNKKLWGNTIGSIVNACLIIITFVFSSVLFNDFITFVSTKYLNNTPVILISLSFGFIIFYSLLKGINSILRASSIFFFVCIILFIISISGLLFKIDINNFIPSLINNYYRGSFFCLSYNLLPIVLLLQIPKQKIVNNNKTFKFILVFYLIAIFSILITVLSVIGIFGWKLSLLYDYPEFEVLKYVYFKGLSSKLDSILFLQNLFDTVIFLSFSNIFCLTGIQSFINKKKNIIYTIFILIFILFNEKISTTLLNILSFKIISDIIFITITFFLLLYICTLLFKDKEPN